MDKEKLELLQNIGYEVCEGCDSGCSINDEICSRLLMAGKLLDEYIDKQRKTLEIKISDLPGMQEKLKAFQDKIDKIEGKIDKELLSFFES